MPVAIQIAVVLGTFATAGAVLDKLLVRRHKTDLHTRLVALWSRIDDTRIGDLPGAVANAVLRRLERLFGSSLLGRRVILFSIFGSWLVTTVQSSVVDYIWGDTNYRVWHDRLPFWPWYVADYIFNTATIVVLVLALRRFRQASFVRSVAVAIVTLTVAFVLAVLCLQVGYWTCDFAARHVLLGSELLHHGRDECTCHVDDATIAQVAGQLGVSPASVSVDTGGTALMEFVDISTAYMTLIRKGRAPVRHVRLTAPLPAGGEASHVRHYQIGTRTLLLNGKTLIAVAILLLLITGALLAKMLLSAVRRASLVILEALTEVDPKADPKNFMPGTLLGAVVGLVAGLVRGMTELVAR